MKDHSSETKQKTSVDQVIHQLRTLITSRALSHGDALPSERKLAEKFGVGRLTIRDAIKRLEFYGLVKTMPKSGTIVKGSGMLAFEGLIVNILDIEETDFASIVETRNLLEIKSAGLAAIRRTDEDISKIQNALKAYEAKISENDSAAEEDFLLHLQIAEVSGNSVLKLLMRIITPDILKNFRSENPNVSERKKEILSEHHEIVNEIIAQNAKGAKNAMRKHLRGHSNMLMPESEDLDN